MFRNINCLPFIVLLSTRQFARRVVIIYYFKNKNQSPYTFNLILVTDVQHVLDLVNIYFMSKMKVEILL